MSSRKQLAVNADDFGFTPDVNAGIVEAHERGILTSTTLMANGSAFEEAVRLARGTPTLDIGCHLVLVQGNSLLNGKPLPETTSQLVAALAAKHIKPYEELRAQVQKILDAGIRPTHLDTHKHTHLAPPVLDAVARLGEEFQIPWVRRPFDFPMSGKCAPLARRMVSDALGMLRRRFHSVLTHRGLRTTDHFAGFQITGLFRTAELAELLRAIPEGTTELMVHPGHCGPALRAARTRLKESREHELEALISPEARDAIREAGIELAGFNRLAAKPT